MTELQTKIIALEKESLQNYNLEQAIKLCINSIYGAFANDYFHFRSTDIAETVTLQGQDAIKYTERAVEKYFKEHWHKDKKLHEAVKGQMPKPKNGLWDAYKEIIPVILKQAKDPKYVLKVDLPEESL